MAIIKYKKGNSWISIPIYVNTGGEVLDYITKLELEGKGYISQIKTINGQSLVGEGNVNIAVDLSNYYTKSEVNGLIPSLNNYYKKSETYSQSEVNELIDSVNAGDVDLSNYYTKSQVDGLIPDDYLTSSSLSGYATQTWVNNKNYAKAADIPTLMSDLTNDLGYLTSVPSDYITSSELNSKLSSYAKTSAIPTAASDLINDMGYLTSIPSQYITESELYRTVTYSQLVSLVNSSSLIPGALYAITDYSCIYIQPVTNLEMEVSASDIKYIICRAVSNSSLSENVEVVRYDGYAKIIECRYSIDPEITHWTKGMTSKTPKGVIYHMKDEYENEANYDFKHVKFRRWAITDISANLNAADGSKNNESPYRFKANANSSYYGSADNERFRVGSGQSTDETLITNIFNGTWSACTSELSLSSIDGKVPYAFTTTYAKNCHKPYTRTEYTTDKYLAWQTNMNGTNGLSYSPNLTYGAGGLSKVTTSTSYLDVYTFHYSGGDWSEIGGCVLNVKLNNLENEVNPSRGRLPNICFILSDGLTPNKKTTVLENVVINTGCDSTFLMRDYANKNLAFLFDAFFNHVRSCLFIIWNWNSVRFNGSYCRYNYINADLLRVTIESNWEYNVIFGYLEDISAGNMQLNLWYNAYYYIQWNNNSSWIEPIDGYKSQYTTLKGYIHANILAPLKYCTFDYHINANTFRNFYNKGVTMKSNKQGISFGRIAYSVLEYGGSNYYADQILNCYFDSVAFYNEDYKFGNIHGWNPSRNKLPKMEQVYVCGGATGHVVDYNTTIPTSWLNTELHPSNQKMGGKLIIYYDDSAGTYKKTDMMTILNAHASN